MPAKRRTFSRLDIDAVGVAVEVDVSPAGLPKTVLVGLPKAAVKESTHRVEWAMVNSGLQRPHSRVIINLAPACSRLSQWERRVFPRRLARFPRDQDRSCRCSRVRSLHLITLPITGRRRATYHCRGI